MKVTIKRSSERYAAWVRVFGASPVEVEPAGSLDGVKRLRVVLPALSDAQRRACARYMAEITHLPADRAARISPTVNADDVIVMEELFPNE